MLSFFIENNIWIIIFTGLLAAIFGQLFRSKPALIPDEIWANSQSNAVYSDGLQGGSIATLVFVAIMVANIAEPKAVEAIKEQAATISLFCSLGSLHLSVQMYRTLK